MKTEIIFMGTAAAALVLFLAWEMRPAPVAVPVSEPDDPTMPAVRGVAAADLGPRYAVDLGLFPKAKNNDDCDCEDNGNG